MAGPTVTSVPGQRQAPWVDAEPAAAHVVAAAALVLSGAAAVEIALRGALGLVVGATLVAVATAAALLVSARDLFTAAVLPPLILVTLLVVVTLVHPDGIAPTQLADSASALQRVIAGFVDLAGALVVAHALALTVVAQRARVARRRGRRTAVPQPG